MRHLAAGFLKAADIIGAGALQTLVHSATRILSIIHFHPAANTAAGLGRYPNIMFPSRGGFDRIFLNREVQALAMALIQFNVCN